MTYSEDWRRPEIDTLNIAVEMLRFTFVKTTVRGSSPPFLSASVNFKAHMAMPQ